MIRKPEEHLEGATGVDRLDCTGQRVAGAEEIRPGGALGHQLAGGRVGPDARLRIAIEDCLRAAGVPEEADQDVGRPSGPLYARVEVRPDRLGVVGWDEWVDEDECVAGLVGDATDLRRPLLLGRPLRMANRPAPKPRRNLAHLHEAIVSQESSNFLQRPRSGRL